MTKIRKTLLGTVTLAIGSLAISPQTGAEEQVISPRMQALIDGSSAGVGASYPAARIDREGGADEADIGLDLEADDIDEDEFDDASDFETDEFNESITPGQINAQAAYAKGAFGAGVTVGVIDGTFDIDVPDLADNIAAFKDVDEANSLDRQNPDLKPGFEVLERFADQLDTEGDNHGTNVTGVIAAQRNGDGIQGVAPEARILAIDTEMLTLFDGRETLEAIEEGLQVEEDIPDGSDESDDAGDEGDRAEEGVDDEDADDGEDEVDDEDEDEALRFLIVPKDPEQKNRTRVLDFADTSLREGAEELRGIVDSGDFDVFGAARDLDFGLVASGVDFAVENGADIINMSLGDFENSFPEVLQQAIFDATDAGRIVVLPAGNEDRVDDETGEPLETIPDADLSAQIVIDERTNGLALAVGAVDENNEINTNNCGTAKERCLVAPGVDVTTTDANGDLVLVDGTSFSAPAVSGSLALLLDMFPTIDSSQAVEILLASATDLGEKGVDEVYGHGLVNLKRAVRPIGIASLPTGDDVQGAVATLASSKLGLSGAFGDAFANVGVLQKGLFLDQFRRPFKADLSDRVIAASRGIDFESALGTSDIETESFTSGAFTTSLSLREDDGTDPFDRPASRAGFAGAAYEDEGRLRALSFSGEIVGGLTMRGGHNLTAGQQLAADPVSGPASDLFLFTDDSLNPQHSFLGKGSGAAFSQQLTDTTSLSFGIHSAVGEGESERGEGFTTQADLRHRFENEAELGLSVSFTGEGSGFLGSEVGGAFADKAETMSQFFTLSGSLPLTESVSLLGSGTMGRSDLSGVEGGIVDQVDNVVSSAFTLGVTKKGILDDKDQLGLMFSQPLRVEGGGDATFLVPTSVNADGSIETTSERADLTPSGRELNLQLAYSRKLADDIGVTTYALMREQPGHDADADRDYGVGMRLNWAF